MPRCALEQDPSTRSDSGGKINRGHAIEQTLGTLPIVFFDLGFNNQVGSTIVVARQDQDAHLRHGGHGQRIWISVDSSAKYHWKTWLQSRACWMTVLFPLEPLENAVQLHARCGSFVEIVFPPSIRNKWKRVLPSLQMKCCVNSTNSQRRRKPRCCVKLSLGPWCSLLGQSRFQWRAALQLQTERNTHMIDSRRLSVAGLQPGTNPKRRVFCFLKFFWIFWFRDNLSKSGTDPSSLHDLDKIFAEETTLLLWRNLHKQTGREGKRAMGIK